MYEYVCVNDKNWLVYIILDGTVTCGWLWLLQLNV